MRCKATTCKNNTDGFCDCPNNITIDENGECEDIFEMEDT